MSRRTATSRGGQQDSHATNGHRPVDEQEFFPSDHAAEEALLGDLNTSPDRLDEALKLVKPEDFHKPANGLIYQAMVDLSADGGGRFDAVTVAAHLERSGSLQAAGGPGRIVEVFTKGSGAWARYARIVAELARDRRRIAATVELQAAIRQGDLAGQQAAMERLQVVEAAAEGAQTTWAFVDLAEALNQPDVDPPSVLHRTDSRSLLYSGRTHWFQGESETLKSWAAQVAAAQVLQAGGYVLYVDFEDDAGGVTSRLTAMGVAQALILERFKYIKPEEPLIDRHGHPTAAMRDFQAALDAHPWTLAVLDGVTEAMTTEGLNLLDNADIATWMRLAPRRMAATGAAAVVLDHVVKAREERGRYAVGGQHKLAGVTGVTVSFEVIAPLSRADGTAERTGKVKLVVQKDRPGHVRSVCLQEGPREFVFGTMEITSFPDGGVKGLIVPPEPGEKLADMSVVTEILEHLRDFDGTTKNKLEETLDHGRRKVRDALTWMLDDSRKWVRVEHRGQSHFIFLTDSGRAQL